MSTSKTTQRGKNKNLSTAESSTVPKPEVSKFLEHVGQRAWTDAEKELDSIRQKSDSGQWSRGYVKALEGLLLTFRSNDDKYSYLPRIMSNPAPDTLANLKLEFAQFSKSEVHGDYDKGYFKAMEDFLSVGPGQATAPTSERASENDKPKDEPQPTLETPTKSELDEE